MTYICKQTNMAMFFCSCCNFNWCAVRSEANRNANLLTTACGSMEDMYLSSRLPKQQFNSPTMARKFTEWQCRR